MNFNRNEICRACATGDQSQTHNYDEKYCRLGRLQALGSLPIKTQIQILQVEERLSKKIADHLVHLAIERKQTVLEVFISEKVI
jgi:hypothetical protein